MEWTGKLLGAQAVGHDGVDKRIDVLATALKAGMAMSDANPTTATTNNTATAAIARLRKRSTASSEWRRTVSGS